MQAKSNKLGGRIWFNIILFGFMGQIAWSVENMYFNTFLYNSVYNGASQNAVNGSLDVIRRNQRYGRVQRGNSGHYNLFAGTLSDKTGKRKWFISIGYILWGIITASFGLISRDNTAALFGLTDEVKILTVTVCLVIVMDCVMTFMGSTGNDAAFNAWVTDVTNTKNRATVESVLALMPLLATAVVMGLAGAVTGIGYSVFFLALGAIVTVCGVLGCFTLKDKKSSPTEKQPISKI